jgi:hypothetical protein
MCPIIPQMRGRYTPPWVRRILGAPCELNWNLTTVAAALGSRRTTLSREIKGCEIDLLSSRCSRERCEHDRSLPIATNTAYLISHRIVLINLFFVNSWSTQPPRDCLEGCAVSVDARHRNCSVASSAPRSTCSDVECTVIPGFYAVCEHHLLQQRCFSYARVAGLALAFSSGTSAASDAEQGAGGSLSGTRLLPRIQGGPRACSPRRGAITGGVAPSASSGLAT